MEGDLAAVGDPQTYLGARFPENAQVVAEVCCCAVDPHGAELVGAERGRRRGRVNRRAVERLLQ